MLRTKNNFKFLGAVRGITENENADAGRWYHYNQRKVPGLWECDTTDTACMYEAEMAYIREREIDRQSKSNIIIVLVIRYKLYGKIYFGFSFGRTRRASSYVLGITRRIVAYN